jgi:hypothetical protein
MIEGTKDSRARLSPMETPLPSFPRFGTATTLSKEKRESGGREHGELGWNNADEEQYNSHCLGHR